jgi:hypothetical protein
VDPIAAYSAGTLFAGETGRDLEGYGKASCQEGPQPPDKLVTPCTQQVCGPDVTAEIITAVRKTEKAFAGWSNVLKHDACFALISLSTGAFAWDIVELHNQEWILDYRPDCATRGGTPPCGSTVQVGTECYYAGSANYVIFGVMFRLCNSHFSSTGKASSAGDFTESEMLKWINRYKGTGFLGIGTPSGNFKISSEWSSAGFHGWPSASPPKGDRNNCKPTCAKAYSGRPFSVHWYSDRSNPNTIY